MTIKPTRSAKADGTDHETFTHNHSPPGPDLAAVPAAAGSNMLSLTMLFLAAAVAAVTLLGTPVKAVEAAHPIETCNGRVTAFVGTGEAIEKGVRMLHVRGGSDCDFF